MRKLPKNCCDRAWSRGKFHRMSALEVLEHLREAGPKELALVRDTAESLLSVAKLTASEDREIADALEESEAQFAMGEGIPAAEAWRTARIATDNTNTAVHTTQSQEFLINVIPEPAILGLLGASGLGLILVPRRRK